MEPGSFLYMERVEDPEQFYCWRCEQYVDVAILFRDNESIVADSYHYCLNCAIKLAENILHEVTKEV